ncbi:HERC1, partial [Symbiodinium sp. CCMP2456]
MGNSMLKVFAHHDEEAAADLSEGAQAVLTHLWALPLRTQGAEQANVFAFPSDPDLEGPRAPFFGGQRQLLTHDWLPVCATQHEACFLLRHFEVSIWCINWDTKAKKPGKLVKWQSNGVGQTVHAFAGNEKGMVYYCGKLFADSFIGRQLLQAGISTADLYARVPLLMSPSKDFVPFWRTVDEQPDELAAGMHKVEDGRSEVGVLRTAAESVVAKGLLTINDNLPGSIFRCPKSCIKLRFHPDEAVPWRAQYGIDIVQTTAARDSPPRLNAQVIAALLMRLCLMDLGLERDTQQQKLEEWLQSLRSHTATHLKDVAWGLDNPRKRLARRAW